MRIAIVQTDVSYGDPPANLAQATRVLAELARQNPDLVVFPEAFLTGYCAGNREEAESVAIARDGGVLTTLRHMADSTGIAIVTGFIESDGGGLFNTVALLLPGEAPRTYRKTHLPELGVDRFVTPGDALPVFDTPWGRIGMLICFDLRAPEAARCLALQGADLILLPTNWPEGAELSAEVLTLARAAENRVWLAACNRVGTEGGFTFIGRSQAVSPKGERVAELDAEPGVLVVEMDLAESREKRIRTIPGAYEWTIFDSRRPELYGELVADRDLGRGRE